MTVPELRAWRVVFRGVMTTEMRERLDAAGITRSGAPTGSGNARYGGRAAVDHPLRVLAVDADDAYVRLVEAVGRDVGGTVIETPTLIRE